MGRARWLVLIASLTLFAFLMVRSLAPRSIDFPDPSDARSSEEMEQAVAAALDEPRAFPRASSLIRLYEGLSPANVEGAARANDARAGEYDPVDLQLFLTAWAHLDPPAAMRAVRAWPIRSRREFGIRTVIREWAASGRQIEAGGYFDSLTDPTERELATGPLVRGWALSGDSEGALGLALRFFETEGRKDIVDGLVRGVLHARGAEGAFALAESVDPAKGGEFAQRLAETTLNLAGRNDPAAAARFFDSVLARAPEAVWLPEALPRVAGLLRNGDPTTALAWLLEKPASPQRTRALFETAATFAKRDFDSAWAWFERNAESVKSGASELSPTDSAILSGLMRRMARIRPAQAAPWAVRLRPESNRLEMLRRVAYFWSALDSTAADAWIATLVLTPDALARVREAAEWGRTNDDTDLEMPSGSH